VLVSEKVLKLELYKYRLGDVIKNKENEVNMQFASYLLWNIKDWKNRSNGKKKELKTRLD